MRSSVVSSLLLVFPLGTLAGCGDDVGSGSSEGGGTTTVDGSEAGGEEGDSGAGDTTASDSGVSESGTIDTGVGDTGLDDGGDTTDTPTSGEGDDDDDTIGDDDDDNGDDDDDNGDDDDDNGDDDDDNGDDDDDNGDDDDDQPPTVSFIMPAAGANFAIGESVAVEVNAEDDQGVEEVDLYLDGSFVRTEFNAPYEWDLSNLSEGDHSIVATATDTSGQESSTAARTFSVGDGGDGGDSGADGGDSGADGGDSGADGGDSGADGGDSGADGGDGGDGGDTGGDDDDDWASNITLTRVEFNQAVAIPVARCGSGSTCAAQEVSVNSRNAPLIKNRPALVRAFWNTTGGWSAHEIEARLTLSYPGGSTEVLSDRKTVSGSPSETTLDGTFHWILSADQMQAGMRYSVGFHELSGGSDLPVGSRPRVPDSGLADLGVPTDDMRLKVVLVPLVHNGTAPDLSAPVLEEMRDMFYRTNPIEEGGLELTVGTSVNLPSRGSSAVGLDAVDALRAQERPDKWVYYEGVADTSVFGGGIAWVTGPQDNSWTNLHRNGASGISNGRWGISVGVVNHETGHNQGMGHAPCNVAGDPDYPYAGGSIGVWGYNVLTQALRSPNQYNDFMGYCGTTWVSDYHFDIMANNLSILTGWWNNGRSFGESQDGFPEAPPLVFNGYLPENGDAEVWSLRPNALYDGWDAEPPYGPVANKVTFFTADGSELEVLPTLGQAYAQDMVRVVSATAPASITRVEDVEYIEVVVDGKSYDITPEDFNQIEF